MTLRHRGFSSVLAGMLVLALVAPAGAAPSGQPIRIGGTLSMTGPLAATALIHQSVGEIYVEQLNKKNGLLGRPVEWVLYDDQSKPDLTRTLYEKLITVDKVDLPIGPYATGNILSAMAVAHEHIMRAVVDLTDRVVVLNYGQLIAEGRPLDVIRQPEVVAAYLGKAYA